MMLVLPPPLLDVPPCGATCLAAVYHADSVVCELREHRLACRIVWLDRTRCATALERRSGRVVVRRSVCPPSVKAAGKAMQT